MWHIAVIDQLNILLVGVVLEIETRTELYIYGNFRVILSEGSPLCKRKVEFLFSNKFQPT